MKLNRKSAIAAFVISIGLISPTSIQSAQAACSSYEECPNDPNSGFTSPAQAAATAAAAAAQQQANAPAPGPISPLAASIPQVPAPPVRDTNSPVDPAAELAAAQARADEQAKIYAEAKTKTDAAQALLPVNSCERFENYNNPTCTAARTAAAKAISDANQLAVDAAQKAIDAQLPANSCDASQNRYLASCIAQKTADAVANNNAVNVTKLKTGYLLVPNAGQIKPSSTVTLVISGKGMKTKTISAQVSSSGEILVPNQSNLAGYQVQVKSGNKVITQVKIPAAQKTVIAK